jgi:hypothetical protein
LFDKYELQNIQNNDFSNKQNKKQETKSDLVENSLELELSTKGSETTKVRIIKIKKKVLTFFIFIVLRQQKQNFVSAVENHKG